ncbi:SDR family NAD(P)-dependent oxidoreductase [Chloroflexota bacterium]
MSPADVTKKNQVEAMVEKVVKEFGRIDVLINNVGMRQSVLPLEVDEDFWAELMDVNLKSMHLCSQAVAKVMIEQKSGSIINVSAGTATTPVATESAAGAAKAGLNQLTRVFAVTLARYGIRVNAISPGLTLTAQAEAGLGPQLVEKYTKSIPLGRAARPEDHVGPAIFLASEAAAFVTGVIVPVTGGPA